MFLLISSPPVTTPPNTFMETPSLSGLEAVENHYNIDTSRPFRSVKEAIAIISQRILAGEMYSHKQETIMKSPSPPFLSPSSFSDTWKPKDDEPALVDSLKKLQNELEETKLELKLLKERESETEVALASLNAELHKNMSKIAEAEAAAAAKAVVSRALVGQGRYEEDIITEEYMTLDSIVGMKHAQSLADVLSIGDKEGYFGGKRKQKIMKKKKPIIPLVGELFSRRKNSSNTLHNPHYSSSQVYYD